MENRRAKLGLFLALKVLLGFQLVVFETEPESNAAGRGHSKPLVWAVNVAVRAVASGEREEWGPEDWTLEEGTGHIRHRPVKGKWEQLKWD